MNTIIDKQHLYMVTRLKRLYSIYEQNRDLINVGAYEIGSDAEIDLAIRMYPQFIKYLNQDISEKVDFKSGLEQLYEINTQLDQLPQPYAEESR